MKPMKFSDKWIEKYSETFEYVQQGLIYQTVLYFINSKYRKVVNVKNWVKPQIEELTEKIAVILHEIPINNTMNFNAVLMLKKLKEILKYVGDPSTWNMTEYWQTIHETLELLTGDCEDGAITLYVLLRMLGVPVSRLMLFAGDVRNPSTGGVAGHCWLGFKPDNYPLHFVFLDWCYYYDSRSVDKRPLYFINENKIFEYINVGVDDYKYNPESNYKFIWFGWNEEFSANKLRRRL